MRRKYDYLGRCILELKMKEKSSCGNFCASVRDPSLFEYITVHEERDAAGNVTRISPMMGCKLRRLL